MLTKYFQLCVTALIDIVPAYILKKVMTNIIRCFDHHLSQTTGENHEQRSSERSCRRGQRQN